MEEIHWFINTKINGSKPKTIYICENDNVLIPFKCEPILVKDINPKSTLELYSKYNMDYNIVVDNRLLLTISYLAFYIDDMLIYDTSCNYIISFNKFVNKLLFNDKERLFNKHKIRNLLFTYSFIKFRCSNLYINWKIDNGIETINKFNYLPHTYNINCLLDYIQSVNPNSELIPNYKTKNIVQAFKIGNNLTKLNLKNKNELLMELFNIKQFISNHLMLL